MTADQDDHALLTARIDELEIRQAFQDDTIERLSQVIARQDEAIRQLQRRFKEASEQMDAITVQLEPDTGSEPPPHY